ncbi:hypothetical protein PV779_63315 [Streptomyces sp. ID01-9D]|nr:hypothetical protein [Streptomyces sp. ID01-9D]
MRLERTGGPGAVRKAPREQGARTRTGQGGPCDCPGDPLALPPPKTGSIGPNSPTVAG